MKKAWSFVFLAVLHLLAGCRQPEAAATRAPLVASSRSAPGVLLVTRKATAEPTAFTETSAEAAGQGDAAPETAQTNDLTTPTGSAITSSEATAVASSSPSPNASPTRLVRGIPTQAAAASQPQGQTRIAATAVSNPTAVPNDAALSTPTAVSQSITGTVPTAPAATPDNLITATPAVMNYDMGHVAPESLVSGLLETNEIHSYLFSIDAASAISVTVIAMPDADVVVSIYNMADELISEQNNAPAGELEQLVGVSLPSPGDYWVQIRITNNVPSPYLLMLLTPDSYAFHYQEMIAIGDTVTANLDAGSDDFWFFAGNAGESVMITAVPNDGGDLFLELYTNAANALGFIDDGSAGELETIANYTLPTSGIYGIHIGEYNFLAAGYQLTLARN